MNPPQDETQPSTAMFGTAEYSRALDEYKVICEYHRTNDQLKWQVLGVTYGGAILLTTASINGRYAWASVATAFAASAVVGLGTAVYFGIHRYILWRLERAWVLEKRLGFDHHLWIRAHYDAPGGKQRINQVIALGYWVPWVAFSAFLVAALLSRL